MGCRNPLTQRSCSPERATESALRRPADWHHRSLTSSFTAHDGREESVRPMTSDIERRMRKGTTLTYLKADFDELPQVRALATNTISTADQLDILINNAGRAGPPRRVPSRDGNEPTLQTNYLALYALPTHVRPLLESGTRRSRVVYV